jgi:methionine sulfoxide reductase catalytic subunit
MLIKIRKASDIPSSEITPESVYFSRRDFMRGVGGIAIGSATGGLMSSAALADADKTPAELNVASKPAWLAQKLSQRKPVPASGPFVAADAKTPFSDVTTYNNFYEFGTDKSDPSNRAKHFAVDPWSVEVAGECNKPGKYTLEDILKPHTLEERVYRLRCVEAWSMVIPWVGFSLGDLLKRFEPNGNAKFVEFHTLLDPKQFPEQGSRFATIHWPYVEGLRMDEAMHPLAIMAVGLYGDAMPAQNGAPIRLVVPWKYGFKSIKSIVSIKFRSDMPTNTWKDLQPSEYGFYANVNPAVNHPRWSQSTERRLPASLFKPQRVETLPFNGYAEEVESLYAGMDLRRNY